MKHGLHVLSAAGIAAGAMVLCAGCVGSSTPSTGAGGTASVTVASSGTGTSGSGSGTGTSAAGGTTAASTGNGNGSSVSSSTNTGSSSGNSSGYATCTARYLNGTVSGEQGTAGSIYVDIVFKNLNNKPCTMYGYPGVSFGAGTPVQQVGQPAGRNPQVSPKLITLQPGGHAYAVLQIGDAGNWPSTTCQPTPTTYLQVYPPNTSNLLYVAYNSTGCKGNVVTLHVEAVQAGTGA
ncbi:MAG TPA: DUF4232 domain-containing protein [Actinospica sp.]|jgi:hypothetical protein|nr:DUF4232 domain-containing protein [Actinospica sp.]